MPIVSVNAIIEIEYDCLCGAHGFEEIEGMSYVNGMWAASDFQCPVCGADLAHAEDSHDFSGDSNYFEDDEEDWED